MKRILSLSLILAGAAAAYGCSKQSSDPADPRPDETTTEPTAEEDAATVPGARVLPPPMYAIFAAPMVGR